MLNTPNIRFKGFTEPWEQRKVKDIAPLQRGFDLPTSQMEEGVYPVVMSNGIGGYHSQYKVKGPGIVTGRSGTIGKLHYIENDYWPHNTTLWVTDFNGNNQKFIYYMYQCLDLSRFSTGSGVPTLNRNDVHDKAVCIPNVGEQKKISEYFSTLDRLITFHQCKCDEMSKLKKFMLQKMFPKKGEQFPEIRFNGFTDAWERRKLGELIEKYEEPVETPHVGYERIGIRSHAKGTFYSYVEAGKELDTAKMHRVAADKFILNITFAWEHAVAITNASDAGKLVSHRFPQFSFGADLKPQFFKYVMLDKKFREHLELSSPGGAGRNRVLKIGDMLKYDVKLPSINEQMKIGQYFDGLDHLITFHQRKCDELKDIKKLMMQNMFPQKG